MKIARGRELLTPDQRQVLMQIPEDEWLLGTYFTFSKRDLEVINKRRREENRLGFAVQLAVLRYPGWSYNHIKSIPGSVIHYISKQIGATPSSISLYPQRENTIWDHLKEIRSEYDFIAFTLKEYRMTFKHLHQLALENGDAIHLLHECVDFLRKKESYYLLSLHLKE
ncbi:hypothetical protein BCM0075_1335 [Bacillus cereus]|nr:hypothetical protein BCM0075_1335 [Bacillus cereus]